MNNRTIVSIHDAKTNLSKLIDQIESGSLSEVIIARTGHPVARLLPIANPAIRLGVADGAFRIPDDIDALSAQIADMFAPAIPDRSK